MDPRVLEEMLPYFTTKFGNTASKSHAFGWEAEEAIDLAKQQVGKLLGAKKNEIIFTSGATEAINLAIKGTMELNGNKGHIITCVTEHKAVTDTLKKLEKNGCSVTYIAVDSNGVLDIEDILNSIRTDTKLIAIMYANNETGVIQPITEIGRIARQNNIPFLCDATQAVGKVNMNKDETHVDLLALSAHKFYGPKGVGALIFKQSNSHIQLISQIDGGGQQLGLRSGTLNVPGIVGLGMACEIASEEMNIEADKLRMLRDYFEDSLSEIIGVTFNGKNTLRLPNCSNFTISGIDGEKFILANSSKIAFSQSAACTSATIQPSHVLVAMGLNSAAIQSSFRISFGRFTTQNEVNEIVNILKLTIPLHRNP